MRTLAVLLLLAASGCCNCAGPAAVSDEKLNPLTLPMTGVVAAVNANNSRLPTLWATLNYSATINDRGQVHSVSSDDGVILYRRPGDFRLVGKKEFVGTVFDLGSNDREYWMEVVPGVGREWWGTYAELARMNPDRLPIPIRPDLVMEVLGVGTINTDFGSLPAPTMRYVGSGDAYVFTFNVKLPDRWAITKEVWYDRATLRPRRVILYDANGRPVLQARLGMDVRVQIPSAPQGEWPVMAGDFKLFFPDSGSRMEFTVKDARLYKQQGRVRIPNAASFGRPDVSGTDVRAVHIGAGGDE